MNLHSCNNCAVVLDLSKISFPDIELDDGSIDTNNAIWEGRTYKAFVECPVCKHQIVDPSRI